MIERCGVVPALRERVEDVRHGRSANLRHGVVPRRRRAVPLVQRRGLGITGMRGVVTTTVTQVHAADERDVLVGLTLASHDDELLVVGPATAHSLVEERLATGLVDDRAEMVVLLAVELAGVGAPQQRPNLHAAACCG